MRLWQGALAGGAQALGRKVDGIRVGNRADVIALDGNHPLLFGRDGAVVTDSFVFSGNANLVRDVVVGGRQVVSDGRHAEEEKIARAYRKAIGELMAG
jgi:formimidoylglutamate deiminase